MSRECLIFHPSKVNGRNIYTYIHSDEDAYLDRGVDSHVYRFGDWILHQFFNIPVSQIRRLQAITAEVARYAPQYEAHIGLWGDISMRATPITKVFESSYHQAFAVERYVAGYRAKEKQNKRLDEFLADFSSDMRQRTGVRGIQIIAPNTKLQKLNRGIAIFAKSTCTVTDICQYMHEFMR